MSTFTLTTESLSNLKDKVIVLTGGGSGIGAATVRAFYTQGAIVVFGDINEENGRKVAGEFDEKRVLFKQMDVTKYEDNLGLVKHAFESFGAVDHAVYIAGILESENLFDPGLTIEDVEKPTEYRTMDVNIIGALHFTRIAAAYLHHKAKPRDSKSILLCASSTALSSPPGFFTYTVSKYGVLGLMRSLRDYLPFAFGIRVNAVCPFATNTAMTKDLLDIFEKEKLPMGSPKVVADVLVHLAAGKHALKGQEAQLCNGLAVLTVGNEALEVEEGMEAMMGTWIGEYASDAIKRHKDFCKHLATQDKIMG